jgi:hypothetical protein
MNAAVTVPLAIVGVAMLLLAWKGGKCPLWAIALAIVGTVLLPAVITSGLHNIIAQIAGIGG